MRIKINGVDMDRNTKVSINTVEASDAAAWTVIIIGALLAVGWWILWI